MREAELKREESGGSRDEYGRDERVSVAAAADRGDHSLACSPADRCAVLGTSLRAFEAELQIKAATARSVHAGTPVPEKQALLVAWELQPMLQHVHDMRESLEAQDALLHAASNAASRDGTELLQVGDRDGGRREGGHVM